MRQMKDSGVSWIGMIPEHWKVETLGRHFSFGKGLPITKADLLPNGVAVISYGQIHAKFNSGITMLDSMIRFVSPTFLESNPQCLLKKGDFVFADTSEDIEGSGNCAYNDYEKNIFAGYHTVIARPQEMEFTKYLAYLFQSQGWKFQIQSLVNGVKVYSINKSILKNSKIILPPLSEQRAIADYLDVKCGEVDALVSLQEEMISELQAYKQALITEAVTHGLNPNAKLVPSGIDWIGDVPEHWEINRIKFVTYNLDYLREPISTEQRERNNPQFDYYGASGVIDKIDYYNVDDRVLLIAEDGANLVMRNLPLIYKAKGKFWVNNHAHILKERDMDYDYLAYAMESADYTKLITGSAQPKLTQSNLGNLHIPVPPLSEQQQIATYLDSKCADIDALIGLKQQKIEELKEWKKSLIFECVTGKQEIQQA